MKSKFLVYFLLLAGFSLGANSPSFADKIQYDQPPKGLVYIRSVQNPYGVWDQPGYPVDYVRGSKLSTYFYEGKRDQLYTFQADRDGWWHIIPQTGGAVTLEGNKDGNGVRLVIWDYDANAANQKFLVQHQKSGKFKIFTKYGRAVTVANRSSVNDSAIQTWDNHDGAWMEWNFIDYSTKQAYIPETQETAAPDKTRAKSGTLKDAISGNAIVKKYFENITFGLFESDNAKKDFQNWMNGLSRTDQVAVYSDILDAGLRNSDDAASRSIFKAVSEV
ncbi:MAG: RICIN domain-containing protein, partial [Spirochaetota bacterium]